MSRLLAARLARLASRVPAPPPPRAAEPDVEHLVGLTVDELMAVFDAQDPVGAARRRAELDALSDAELLEEFQRR
jgi:hypothetical protein